MSHELLCNLWFVLLGALLVGYAILDGFDLGVGILHPFVARNDEERRLSMNAIGPLWDGNEVWLVTFGGALFAAFPGAYATVFSGFYTAFMLLLMALISRAVSMEFRSKVESHRWRRFWDWAFFGGSLLATFLFGVAVGNVVLGLPLDREGNVAGTVIDQLGAYPVLVGIMTVFAFAAHGGIYLYLKTEGAFQNRLRSHMWRMWGLLLVAFLTSTVTTLVFVPAATESLRAKPWSLGVVLLLILAIANVPRSLYEKKAGQAFASSAVVIACFVGLLAVTVHPNLVPASNDPAYSVTIYSAASSKKTLEIMLTIAAIGMPLVITYTSVVYWTFRGKVRLDEHSY